MTCIETAGHWVGRTMVDGQPRLVGTRDVYENKWMRVHDDQLIFDDGARGIYGVVDKPDYALIVPVHSDGRLQLVEQFRYAVQGRYWECPQGSWEDAPNTDTKDLAQAELNEETGFRADRLKHVGHLFGAYGFCNQGFHVFVATNLHPVQAQRDMQEQDMKTAAFELSIVKEMIATGHIKDAPTISALGLLLMSGHLYW